MIASWIEENSGYTVHIGELPVKLVLGFMLELQSTQTDINPCVCESIANIIAEKAIVKFNRVEDAVEYDADQTSGPVVYQMLKMYGVPQKVLSSARGVLRRNGYKFSNDVCYATEDSSGASLKWFMNHASRDGNRWITNLMKQIGTPEGLMIHFPTDFQFRIHMLQTIVDNNPDAAFKDFTFSIW